MCRRNILIVFLFLLSPMACVSGPPGISELKALCEKDYGITVNEKVDAKGYLDATTGMSPHYVDDIIDVGFEFVEYCYDKPTRNTVTQQPGCWQVYKAKQGSTQCDANLNKGINKWVGEPYVSWRQQYCFAVKKVEKPEAKIALYNEFIEKYKYDDDYEILRSTHWIKDVRSQKIIAQSIKYSSMGYGPWDAQHGCMDPLVTGKDYGVHKPNFYRNFFWEIRP